MRGMSDRSIVWLVRGIAAMGVVMAVGGSALLILLGHVGYWNRVGGAFALVLAVFFGLLTWVVIAKQPRNRAVWAMVAPGFFMGWYLAGATTAALLVDPGVIGLLPPTPSSELSTTPADLPRDVAWVLALSLMAWVPAILTLLTVGLLLFPDGRPPSPRWRPLVFVSIVMIAVATIASSWSYRPGSTRGYNDDLMEHPWEAAFLAGGVATAAVAIAALIHRFRRSRGETRQQFKWISWGAGLFLVSFVVVLVLEDTSYRPLGSAVFFAGGAALLVSYGTAVAKYRLYDIDVVISRTFVYGALAVFITAVYVGAVVGVGALLGGDEPSPWLSIGATAFVAFAFEPLRQRLQRIANRIVYGRRATPYEVLSDFTRNIGSSDMDLLGQVARSLAEGTTAAAAAVWVATGDGFVPMAAWPSVVEPPTELASGLTDLPADLVGVVTHDGEVLGAITLSASRGQMLLPADERLLEQMASGMGLALRNIWLGQDLKKRVDDLRDSRQRLVTAQDEIRRHLERDLRDGPQRTLVGLEEEMSLLQDDAEELGMSQVAAMLENTVVDTERTIGDLREFARGVYPSVLETEGLAAAISAQSENLPWPVTIHAAGLGRHERSVESAVYFSVLEALQNVAKHAAATSAHVALHQDSDALRFEVSDDGRGFDPESVVWGSGLANLTDRLDALDGELDVDSSPGKGATVLGIVPTRTTEVLLDR